MEMFVKVMCEKHNNGVRSITKVGKDLECRLGEWSPTEEKIWDCREEERMIAIETTESRRLGQILFPFYK